MNIGNKFERLIKENAQLDKIASSLLIRTSELKVDNARLRAALESVEWSDTESCPWCQ